MTYEDLKKYVKGVFDLEMELYVQTKSLQHIQQVYDELAVKRLVASPVRQVNRETVGDYVLGVAMFVGVALGALTALFMLFFGNEGFLGNIFVAILAFLIFGVIGFVGGLPIGVIYGIVQKGLERKRIEKQYQADWQRYHEAKKNESLRMEIEVQKKAMLSQEWDVMEQVIRQTKQNLQKVYGYGVIAAPYRNLTAIGTIYSYLQEERTFSLGFDRKTGDPGAYNIYRQEKQMEKLITNTDEILNRLDEIAYSQRILASSIQKANNQIEKMGNEFRRFAAQNISKLEDIREIECVNSYTLESIDRQAKIMNWMTFMRW